MTAVTRSAVVLRSSSAKIRIMRIMASPMAEEVSNCSFLETKVTPRDCSSSCMAAKSIRLRLIRSIFQTTRWVNSPVRMRSIMA